MKFLRNLMPRRAVANDDAGAEPAPQRDPLKLDFTGKVALVTGASGDLGSVFAQTLAAGGAHVAVHYHTGKERADAVVASIREAGGTAEAFAGDITRQEDVMASRDAIREHLGDPAIVVANAVAQIEWKTVLEQPPEDYRSQFDSCVMQNVLLAKAFIPAMQAAGWGRYIGISTEVVMQYLEIQSAYSSGKRGMDGVLRVLAREVGGHGITVNQVAPGWTITPRQPVRDDEGARAYAERTCLRRRGEAQEIANVVAFLASDLSSYLTGAWIPVCGGHVMPAI